MLAGVTGFLRVQYTAIARIAVLLSIVITLSYLLRPEGKQHGIEKLGNAVLGMLGSFSFIMVILHVYSISMHVFVCALRGCTHNPFVSLSDGMCVRGPCARRRRGT